MSSTSTQSTPSAPPPSSSSSSSPSQSPSTSSTPPSTSSSRDSSTSSSSSTSVPQLTSSTSSQPPSSTTPSSTSSTPTVLKPNLTPSESPSTYISVSNGNTIFVTTVIRSTPTATGVVNTNTSKGFFENTGAVAGTFTVVGLVGLAILIFIITAVIRRRRAERFDKDVALAAAEAAATAHNPGFDDDYGYGSAHPGVGGYGYADTYQAPVQFPPTRETYGMSNIGATSYPDPDNYTVGAGRGPGAAGIGAGALYRSKSGKDQPDPFNAYAVPQDSVIPQQQANLRYRNPGQDHWGDQNLAGGGYDVARSQPYTDSAGVARNKSIQSSHPAQSLASNYSTDPLTQDSTATVQPPPVPDSYLDRYRAGFDPEKHLPQTRPLSEISMTDAYGGIITGKQHPVPEKPRDARDISNPFEGYSSGDRISGASDYSEGVVPVFAHDDARISLRDDEDYGAGRRVLKVANE